MLKFCENVSICILRLAFLDAKTVFETKECLNYICANVSKAWLQFQVKRLKLIWLYFTFVDENAVKFGMR
jgi:hypothetical protein